MPISLDLLKTHGGPKRLPCHRNELLSHLKTDHSHTRCERVSDKILGSLGLLGNLQVKGVNENTSIEKVPSGVHSSHRA